MVFFVRGGGSVGGGGGGGGGFGWQEAIPKTGCLGRGRRGILFLHRKKWETQEKRG